MAKQARLLTVALSHFVDLDVDGPRFIPVHDNELPLVRLPKDNSRLMMALDVRHQLLVPLQLCYVDRCTAAEGRVWSCLADTVRRLIVVEVLGLRENAAVRLVSLALQEQLLVLWSEV